MDVILVAPAELVPALRTRCEQLGSVQAFAEADALAALDAVFASLPREVALERGFAESARGRAFLRRVTDDTFGRECLIRVVDAPVIAEPATPAQVSALGPSPADGSAADSVVAPRATPRLGVIEGTTTQIDGTTMALIDLSAEGMQVLGTLTLKPNQAVRVTLPDEGPGLRVRGRVAWATLELGGRGGPRYRAGLAFVDADRTALDAVVTRLTVLRA